MLLDRQIFAFLNGFAGISPTTDELIVAAAEYLPVLVVIVGCIALVRMRATRWAIDALAAAILARSVVVAIAWEFFDRDRPFVAETITHLFTVNHPSFPSAHTSFLFAFSTVAFLRHRLLGSVLYAGSFIVCLARVAAGVHYPSDILGGIVVGVASGLGIAIAARLIRRT